MPAITLDYTPQPRQKLMHESPARLILYGGAVGGGKSHALRWEAIRWCLRVPGIQVYLFRRSLQELESNHVKQLRTILPPELVSYNDTKKEFSFVNGSSIYLCYCDKEKDVERYQGTEIHVLLVDEAGHLSDYQLNYLIGRSRLGGFSEKVDEKYRHALPRAVFASNPGGPGHNFLKQAFIEPAPPEELFYNTLYKDPDDPTSEGRLSVFIPAQMQDNAYIDADYAGSLQGLPPELAKALREGDWDSVVGQALHTLSRDKHMLRPFVPPRHWTHFMSMDWGSAAPFSVGWYCVSEGGFLKGEESWPERYLPPGAVIRYAEWYGWNGRPNQGLKLDSRAVAKRMLEIEKEREDPPMDYRIADNAMWNRLDGISIAENMAQATNGVLKLRKSRKSREHNYNEVLCRLAGSRNYMEDGQFGDEPMFYATANCQHFWRTVPTLVLDQTNPERGPDTKLEDHVYDELAYALRSRPYVTTERDRVDVEYRESTRRFLPQSRYRDPYATA